MDYWLRESLCGLFKASCCLEEMLSEAFPPSSFLRWLITYSLVRLICWESILEQPLSIKNSGCLVLGCFAVGALTVCTQLRWLWLPQSPLQQFCVGLSCCSTNLREEMNEKLDCHDVCPDLVYNIQLGSHFLLERFVRKKHFKKFQSDLE